MGLNVDRVASAEDLVPPATRPTTGPGGDAIFRDFGAEPSVLLFVGANDEIGAFDAISGGANLHIISRAKVQRVLGRPDAFADARIVVWGRSAFRDTPASQITEEVEQAMQSFVRAGGDLVFLSQNSQTNMGIVEKLFHIKVAGGTKGAQVVDPQLKRQAAAVGYDEAALAKVQFVNSYPSLPAEAIVLLRSDDKKHPATGAIIPVGKGRLVLLGIKPDSPGRKLEEEFLERIYYYKPVAERLAIVVEAPAIEGDPMDWPAEPALPALRELLSPQDYDRRFKAALAKINIESLRRPDRPTGGAIVYYIHPGGRAEQLGVKVGDIITAIDGDPIGEPTERHQRNAPQASGKRQLTFWTPRDGLKTIEAENTPMFGFYHAAGWRPADAYARSAQHDARWDDQMFVAATSFHEDPDLAEMALCRAQKAGYDGSLLLPLATKIAFRQIRFDDCLAFGWQLIVQNRGVGKDLAGMLHEAALLNFKLDQAMELARRFPNVIDQDPAVAEAAKAYRAFPSDKSPNPVAMLPKLHRTVVETFSPFIPDGQFKGTADVTKWAANEFNKNRVMDLVIPTNHQMPYTLKPAFANVAMTVKFDLHETDDDPGDYAKCIRVGLFNTSVEQPPYSMPSDSIQIMVTETEETVIDAFGMEKQTVRNRPPHLPDRCRGTLQFVILHHRCEVTLDGRRVYYGPVLADEATRKYGLWMQTVGMSGRIERPVMAELADSP
jgi:hypothetical protein